jgi:hypothetical protein
MATEAELAQALSPAFGVYPKAFRGNYGNPEDAANLPVDVLRGRTAGLLGMFGDVVNQPIAFPPVRAAQLAIQGLSGQEQYKYPDTEHFLKTMPLAPTSRAGEVAGQAASYVPLNPAPAVRAVGAAGRALGPTAANMAEGYLQKQGLIKNIFVGENAKTWNKEAAKTAVEMEKVGAKPEDIWSVTGTFRGPEGKLRQEISDKYSTIKGVGNFEDVIMKAYDRGVERTRGTGQREYWQPYKTTVDDVLFHHNLSEAYPELMKIESQLTPTGSGSKGQLMLTDKDLIMQIRPDLQGKKAESTMLHELQHGVQEKEGFAKGGSVEGVVKEANKEAEAIAKKLNKMPYGSPQYEETYKKFLEKRQNITVDQAQGMYKRLAGEAEARAVQSRMLMTDDERRAKFPYQSYDVPINELIVKR